MGDTVSTENPGGTFGTVGGNSSGGGGGGGGGSSSSKVVGRMASDRDGEVGHGDLGRNPNPPDT